MSDVIIDYSKDKKIQVLSMIKLFNLTTSVAMWFVEIIILCEMNRILDVCQKDVHVISTTVKRCYSVLVLPVMHHQC